MLELLAVWRVLSAPLTSTAVYVVSATKRTRSVRCSLPMTTVGGLAEKFVGAAYDEGGMDFAPNQGGYRHST